MIRILILLVFALVFAYFASQNSVAVRVQLFSYSFKEIPLYVVIIASVSVGFLVGFLLNLVSKFFLYREISNKKKQLEEAREHTLELTKRVHQFELEKQELKADVDENSL